MITVKKSEFLYRLDERLDALPPEDVKRSLDYYAEMIDERVESGMSEEEAVAELSAPEDIAEQILGDIAPKGARKVQKRTRKMSAFTIVLLVLGSPVWVSLLIAAFAVILCLYVSLWAVIISLWATFGSLVGGTFGAIVCAVGHILGGNTVSGIAILGAGTVCAGLSILLFYVCKWATKAAALLPKWMIVSIKNRSGKKEAAQ